MFEIEYLSASSLENIHSEKCNETAFRYKLFLGDVIIRSDTSRIDLIWGWIPLLDFAYALTYIVQNLLSSDTSREEFEFTESNELLIFTKNRNSIHIATSFSEDFLEANFLDFKRAVDNSYSKLINEIKEKNSQVLNNPNFIEFEKRRMELI